MKRAFFHPNRSYAAFRTVCVALMALINVMQLAESPAFAADGGMANPVWLEAGYPLLIALSLFLWLRLKREHVKLKERKARLRAVIRHAADGITLIDGEGVIEEFNPACEALFGYSAAEVMGRNVTLLMPEPYHSEHVGPGREVQGRRKDGGVFDIDLRVSEVVLPGRTLYMGMFRDITGRKRAEETNRHLMDKLAESNAELERFAYVASHDLREPLRQIANFSTLLKKEYDGALDETGREYLGFLHESAARMHGMVGDLLEYARIGNEELRYSRVSMEAEMRHVRENLASFITEHGAEVSAEALPDVMGNAVQLMRLLQNLVGNGIKFHTKDAAPKVHVSAEEKDDVWQFCVRDNGIGLAPEYAQQIFEPFRQLHARNDYRGTGIGLAVCKRIVEKHEGKIWVESKPGNGSAFYFTLPS